MLDPERNQFHSQTAVHEDFVCFRSLRWKWVRDEDSTLIIVCTIFIENIRN
jgi:hypothetical protein